MKKLLAISLILTALSLCGCSVDEETSTDVVDATQEHSTYFQSGRYYFSADLQGEVVTEDGNIWGYTQDIISEEPSYHNEPVVAIFNDNGTPDVIEDDIILGLVLDRETAIYDALEVSLSEAFKIERDGNNIRIQSLNVVE